MRRDLQPLFDPRSVAILGASNDPAKWGNWLARGAMRGSHRRPVYLVNRNGGEVLGERAYASVGDLPEAPELVVIAVPAAAFEQAVDDALAAGARALIGITAGLGESGGDAGDRERALVERVRAAGAMMLGPNCLGVFDASSDLGLASNEFPAGSIGLISQSGNLALELGMLARRVWARLLTVCLERQPGRPRSGRARLVLRGARTQPPDRHLCRGLPGRPRLRGGCCVDGQAGDPDHGRAQRGQCAGGDVPYGGSGQPAGHGRGGMPCGRVHLVSTPSEMIDLAQALLQPHRLAGPRVAVFGDGGGHGAIACDVAAAAGLDLPQLSDRLSATLAALAVDGSDPKPGRSRRWRRAGLHELRPRCPHAARVGRGGRVLMTGYFGGYSQYSEDFAEHETEVGREIARAVAESGRPLVAQSMYHQAPPNLALREGGVPVYATIEAAVAALAALRVTSTVRPPPPLPPPAPAPIDNSYFGSRDLLAAAGVPFVAARRVTDEQEALEAAEEVAIRWC